LQFEHFLPLLPKVVEPDDQDWFVIMLLKSSKYLMVIIVAFTRADRFRIDRFIANAAPTS
jgi:hypothetical protein